MSQVLVNDYCIWTKHIYGNEGLRDAIHALAPGAVISLRIAGRKGDLVKMKNGADGRASAGLRPIGNMKAWWGTLYKQHRDELTTIALEPQP